MFSNNLNANPGINFNQNLRYTNHLQNQNPHHIASNSVNRNNNNLTKNNTIAVSNNGNILNVSIENIIDKIRKKLILRGTTGILSIGKSFRINDSDNSKSISFSEFSNLCSRYGLGLIDTEIRSTFALFDKSRNGFIDYEEFLKAIRGGLNQFRKNLVEQAFGIMDKNRNGIIDYNDIISSYDATKHPSVMKGERTAESVYNEFISSFQMNHENYGTNKANFKITKDEWLEYYENVSMSIDDDAYFELMMNNCWRMNTNTTFNNNMRGWANVNEGNNIQSLQDNYNKRYNNNGNTNINNLNYPGQVNNYSVNKFNNFNNNNLDPGINNNNIYNNSPFNNFNINNQQQMNQMQLNQQIPQKNTIMQNPNPQKAFEKGQAVLEKFRQKLFSRGSNSLLSLARQFKIIDDDNSKALSFNEFVKVCKDFKIDLTQSESLALFNLFDRNRNNEIDYNEFLRIMKGEMSERRKALVRQVFSILDANKSGVIEIQDLKNKYNMRKNPEVLNGKKSEEEAYGEFLQTLEYHFNIYKGKLDRKITFEEFIEYYNNISCSIDNDEYFETMIKNAWNLDRNDYNKIQRGWVSGNYNNDTQGNYEMNNSNNNSSNNNETYNYGHINYNNNNSNSFNNNNFSMQQNPQIQQQNVGLQRQPSMRNSSFPINDPILKSFREKILSRGIKGILSIQRSFRIADRDRSFLIDNEELIKLLKNYRFDVTDKEIKRLFEVFDSDRSGKIDFNEFIYAIVGEMNEFRKNLVKKAFMILDKTGNGRVEIDDIRGTFNAKMHPDVKSGKKSEDEILASFLDNFEMHFSYIVIKLLFNFS